MKKSLYIPLRSYKSTIRGSSTIFTVYFISHYVHINPVYQHNTGSAVIELYIPLRSYKSMKKNRVNHERQNNFISHYVHINPASGAEVKENHTPLYPTTFI